MIGIFGIFGIFEIIGIFEITAVFEHFMIWDSPVWLQPGPNGPPGAKTLFFIGIFGIAAVFTKFTRNVQKQLQFQKYQSKTIVWTPGDHRDQESPGSMGPGIDVFDKSLVFLDI